MKKLGIVFILVGFFIPLILFFLSTGYHPQIGLLANIMYKDKMKLHVWTVVREKTISEKTGGFFDKYREDKVVKWKERITIPYRYVPAGGIVLIFLGVGIITLSKKFLKKD